MLKGFIVNISIGEEESTATIMLETKKSLIVPLEMLPRNIEVDDFIIINNGVITIDPQTDEYRDMIRNNLDNILNK